MRRPSVATWTALGLAAAGFCLRAPAAIGRSLNTDEVYFALAARDGGVWRALFADVHPPLYPLFLSALTRLGVPEIGWRFASILCWIGAGLFAWRLGRRIAGEMAGLFALALLMVAPQGFSLSLAVRSYAPATLLAAWTFAAFAALCDAPDRRRSTTLAVAAALACYCFYYNLLLLAGIAAAGLCLARRKHAAARPTLRAAALAGVLFAPGVPLLLRQYHHSLGGGWFELEFTPRNLVRRLAQIFAQASGLDGAEMAVRHLLPSIAGAFGVTLTFVLLAWGYWRLRQAEPAAARGRLAALSALPIAAVVSAIAGHWLLHAFFALHYFTILAAPIAVVVVAPFALARRAAAAGALFAVLLVADASVLGPAARRGDEPLRPAVQWIDARLGPHDVGLGVAWFAADAYRYYGRGRTFLGVPADLREATDRAEPRVQRGIAEAADLARLPARIAGANRIALLLTHDTWRGADRGVALTKQTLAAAGFAPAETAAWPLPADPPAVRAELWRRSPGKEQQ
jgi:hypothetical protein